MFFLGFQMVFSWFSFAQVVQVWVIEMAVVFCLSYSYSLIIEVLGIEFLVVGAESCLIPALVVLVSALVMLVSALVVLVSP